MTDSSTIPKRRDAAHEREHPFTSCTCGAITRAHRKVFGRDAKQITHERQPPDHLKACDLTRDRRQILVGAYERRSIGSHVLMQLRANAERHADRDDARARSTLRRPVQARR